MKAIRNADDFTKAYDRFADDIFRHCYFRVSSREIAEELVQETFIRTWNYIKKGNRIDQVRPFLYRIANNLIVDEYRSRRESVSLDSLQEKGFDISDSGEDGAEVKTEAKLLLEVMSKIDGKYRDVVLMRYVDNLGPKEIAEITGETQNNVSVRINRGVKEIKGILKEMDDGK